tara:strand:- start:629 stop:1204 length:576 start_codon:yes stop_codon:yes gene_type:complete
MTIQPCSEQQIAIIAQKTSGIIEAASGPLSIDEIASVAGFTQAEVYDWSSGFITPWHWLIVYVTRYWLQRQDMLESKVLSIPDWLEMQKTDEYQHVFMKVFVISRKLTAFYGEDGHKIAELIGPELLIQRRLTRLLDPDPQVAMKQYAQILASSFLITGQNYFENVLSPTYGFPFNYETLASYIRSSRGVR